MMHDKVSASFYTVLGNFVFEVQYHTIYIPTDLAPWVQLFTVLLA